MPRAVRGSDAKQAEFTGGFAGQAQRELGKRRMFSPDGYLEKRRWRRPPAHRFKPPTGSAPLRDRYERPLTSRGHLGSRGVERRAYAVQVGRAKTRQVGKKGYTAS